MRTLRTLRMAVLVCAVSVPVIGLVGCGSLLPPEASALAKIATNHMNSLTGVEIIALKDSFAPEVPLTQAQADAIAQFLAANNITNMTALQDVLNRVQTDPGSIVLPEGFEELFTDFQVPAPANPA